MKLNLSVFPLVNASKICIHQKCLLPASTLASSVRCGTWAKCVLHSSTDEQKIIGGVICQIYEQISVEQFSSIAFLDATVTLERSTADLESAMLAEIQPLVEETEINAVELIVLLKQDFLHSTANKWSLTGLQECFKILLQAYCLTDDCWVASNALSQLGIKAINVKATNCKQNAYFSITDGTTVNIEDVRLDIEGLTSSQNTFYNISCEAAFRELKDLVERSQNKAFRSCLNALLIGPNGCGKSTLMMHFAKQLNCNYFPIATKDIMGQYPGETEGKLRSLFESALKFVEHFKPKAPTLIHIEDLQLLCPATKSSSKDAGATSRLCAQLCLLLDKLYSSNASIICVATATDSKSLHKSLHMPGRFQQEIEIEPLNDSTRLKLFLLMLSERFPSQLLADATTAQDFQTDIIKMGTIEDCQLQVSIKILDLFVCCTTGYVAADIALLVRSIEQAKLHGSTSELSELIGEMLGKSKPTSLRSTDVTVIKSEHGFESIGGMQALKQTLKLNILTGMQRAEAYKRFGLSLPKGILLYGPPGCAKTTIAKCLAAEARMTFIATSGAEVYSPYVGCAEKFISKLFDTARKHAPCLIFLDEIDTLVGNRSVGNTQSSNDVQTRILSTLLTEMDGIVESRLAAEAYILVVAATNRPNMIDDALLRPGRFDQLIHVQAPDYESRLSILELHKQRMPFAADCILTHLAERTENFSGADICNLCNEAAMYAFHRDFDAVEIKQADFESVLKSLRPSLTQRQIDAYFDFKKTNLS